MSSEQTNPRPLGVSSVKVAPGDVLADKYRVDQVLGSGGMGVVVAAEHIELREKVAIKFLLDEAADNVELSERFLREARAAVKIKSEHVVRVIDVGRLPSGAPYMVMEYLQGEDLSERLERGPLAIEDAVDFIIQSCEAMNVAHRSGIVHRDLKPANLFLTERPDGSPIIKVLDFGISKVNAPEAGELRLTQTQAMMGSPLYMSPEQMRSSKDVDRRTDVWSLGVILHELIAGDVPFSGSTFPEVLVKVMADAPPRLRTLRPEVPAELEAVVLRCLSKSAADRYPSVAALAVALAPFASPRTLGLHGRLAQSLSVPAPGEPGATAPRRAELGVTRVEGGAPEHLGPMTLPEVVGTLPSAGVEPRAAALQQRAVAGTNTAWEDSSEPPRVPVRSLRWVAFVAAAAVGLAPIVWGLSRARTQAAPAAPALAKTGEEPSGARQVDRAPAARAPEASALPPVPAETLEVEAPAAVQAPAPTAPAPPAATPAPAEPAATSTRASAPARALPKRPAPPRKSAPAVKESAAAASSPPPPPVPKVTEPAPQREAPGKGRGLSIDFK